MMDSKTFIALLAFGILLFGCGGQQPPAEPQEPATVEPAIPSSLDGIELGFNESQSLDDLDAAGGNGAAMETPVPSELDGVELTFNETESLEDLDALSS